MSEMIGRVADAIKEAGLDWLEAQDPKRQTLTWADVPDEIFAKAAIQAMRHLPEEPGPRYTAGEYSRRNQEAMVDDALGS
jgi:hypothetical protein